MILLLNQNIVSTPDLFFSDFFSVNNFGGITVELFPKIILGEMETQKIIEYPQRSMDKRPRKRPRLTWDVQPPLSPAPPPPKVL